MFVVDLRAGATHAGTGQRQVRSGKLGMDLILQGLLEITHRTLRNSVLKTLLIGCMLVALFGYLIFAWVI